jgi:uncharacterized protein YyaL (SSP411 family)
VFTVRGLNRELLTHYVATWPEHCPASLTRSKVRERLRSFLRYCYQSEWLTRIPQISKIEVDQAPTLPLSAKEYEKLLDATYATFANDTTKETCHQTRSICEAFLGLLTAEKPDEEGVL